MAVYGVVSEKTGVSEDVLCAIFIAIGLAFCFAGYRLYKITLTVSAFFFLGTIGYGVALDASKDNVTAAWITFFICGIIGALLAWPLYKASIFLLAAAGGAALGKFLTNSFLYKIAPDHYNTVSIVSMIVLGLACGILALCFIRPGTILMTSWVGAYLAVAGAGHFIGDYGMPSTHDVKDAVENEGDLGYEVRKAWWYYFASTIVLFVAGSIVQFKYTANKYYHFEDHRHGYDRA